MTKPNVSRASRAKIGGMATTEPCPDCGIVRDPQGRPFSITFGLPDVIFDIEKELLETWGDDPFIAIKNVGFFLRVLMPVQLTDGFSVVFGTWLEIDSEDFRTAWQTWNFPEYKELAIDGYVANRIKPWKTFPTSLVHATVRDVDQVPYLVSSDEQVISRVLTETWPHADVLKPYRKLLKTAPKLKG
jgi:hypothetical protein